MTSGFRFAMLVFTAVIIPAWCGEPPQADRKDDREHQRAEEELRQEKKQRILGVIPNFNTSYIQDAAALSAGQKFRLALRSSIDPFAFVAAGLDAGFEQSRNGFSGYGQGAQGYGKRFGAAYADSFSGNMFGGAIVPALVAPGPAVFP